MGQPGNRGYSPHTPLKDGNPGRPGTVHFTVVQSDSSIEAYTQPYMLRVYSYDVIDENEDGIFEPSEHVIVKNLVVENIGKTPLLPLLATTYILGQMPSPRHNPIAVSILSDGVWLQPANSIELPRHILPGQKVPVVGELRALIREELPGRLPGAKLIHRGLRVQLSACFDRLKRNVLDFHKDSSRIINIDIQYPIELDAPRYLDSVASGDVMKISWNVSFYKQCLSKKLLTV